MALMFKDMTATSASTRQPRSAMGAAAAGSCGLSASTRSARSIVPRKSHARVLLQKRDDTPVARHQPKEHTKMNTSTDYRNIDLGALAMLALEGAAEALRKSQPELSKEQAFAKVYCDPANRGCHESRTCEQAAPE